MSSTMMFERSMMGSMGTMGSMPQGGIPSMAPATPSMMMVPRCTMKFEKCAGGMKLTCTCEDEMSAATLQNLCKMMAGGMCSCSCMMNGMTICQCSFCMCNCKVADTKHGVCFTCTSGDKACCDMCQSCCDCVMKCIEAGCVCCLMMGGMPVCCCSC